MTATESALGWAVAPPAGGEVAGLAAAVGAVVGAGAAVGAAVGAGDGGTTATGGSGEGDSGPTDGTGAGLKDSWVPAPSRWNWKMLAATRAPSAMTMNNAGKRKRSVSFGRIRAHFSGIYAAFGTPWSIRVRAAGSGPEFRPSGLP